MALLRLRPGLLPPTRFPAVCVGTLPCGRHSTPRCSLGDHRTASSALANSAVTRRPICDAYSNWLHSCVRLPLTPLPCSHVHITFVTDFRAPQSERSPRFRGPPSAATNSTRRSHRTLPPCTAAGPAPIANSDLEPRTHAAPAPAQRLETRAAAALQRGTPHTCTESRTTRDTDALRQTSLSTPSPRSRPTSSPPTHSRLKRRNVSSSKATKRPRIKGETFSRHRPPMSGCGYRAPG